MDSIYSRHIIGRIENFLFLKAHEGGNVSFGNGNEGYIVGIGKIGNSLNEVIDDVYFVGGLKFSIMSIAQICDKGNIVRFRSEKCSVIRIVDGKKVLTA